MAANDVNTYYKAETKVTTATAAAPGAGAAVATIASGSLPSGLYEVQCYVAVTGTVAAAAETDNFELREGATVVESLPIIITGTTASTEYSGPYRFLRILDGATALSINATGAATASSVYRAMITATKVASSGTGL